MGDKNKKEYTNKCFSDSEKLKNCTVKIFTSPSNWVIAILTYIIWSLVGMGYSTNQNFNMVTAQQHYVMLLSLVSIIVAFVSYDTRLLKLALIGAITLPVSFITVAASQVGIIWFEIPIGYCALCPITIFLFLLQVKQICRFACAKYYGEFQISDCSAESANKNLQYDDEGNLNKTKNNKYKK